MDPIKSALHHWWPRTLSRFWAAADGCTTQASWDGKIVRSPPEKFGAIKNAHLIKLAEEGTVWDTNFEPVFGSADGIMSDLVSWLLTLDSVFGQENSDLEGRLLAQPLPKARREQLAECLSSLIVRSPRFRNKIAKTVEYYSSQFGDIEYTADKKIIAMNMRDCHQAFLQNISHGGKFAVLFCDNGEFLFSDGFYHNFPCRPNPHSNPKCIVPLTPDMAVIFSRPMSYLVHPELLTIRLIRDELEFFNELVQVYSGRHLFWRQAEPILTDRFRDGKFYELKYHRHEWLDYFFDEIANFVA